MLEQQEVTAENSATTSYNNFIILPPPKISADCGPDSSQNLTKTTASTQTLIFA